MTQSIEKLAEKRRKWVEANRENGFEAGLKRLLTDLYPDNAHFIYELLQNAEDARAQEVRFILHEDRIEFEHDGERLFTIQDVDAITSIGFSTKSNDTTNIGKFGVGFKAVFAYSDIPEIESGDFHFRIRDMVVPEQEGLSKRVGKNCQTRFILPFNSSGKPSNQAVKEIENLLKALDATTLLFLKYIRKIEYLLIDTSLGHIERIELGNNSYEIRTQQPDEYSPLSTWFLKFGKEVQVEDEESDNEDNRVKTCNIAVAFGLSPVESKAASKKKNNDGSNITPEWELVPMEPGSVCIYFPADKETSNLRFHIHAPFASTVARDSVRDCAGNNALRDHIADLLAESMHKIRDQGLLNVHSLSLLPNDKDNLSEFYKPLMDRLVEEFKEQNLVPMKIGGHAPALGLFRGPKALSELISDEDMVTILGGDYFIPIWAANPPQRNQREDNFLSSLDIDQWTTDDLVEALGDMDVDARTEWLRNKDEEWHQNFYELLMGYLESAPKYPKYKARDRAKSISRLPIVRVSDGTYFKGSKCYFPTDVVEYDERFPRVSKGIYITNDGPNKKVREFLEAIGVREVDEKVEIEVLLRKQYSEKAVEENLFRPDIAHTQRFIKFIQSYPDCINMFEECYIFKLEDGKWGKPEAVYIDKPYLDTGLKTYYEKLGDDETCWALSSDYKEFGHKELVGFAKKVGVKNSLPISAVSCRANPQWESLSGAPGGYGNSLDIDYNIYKLNEVLESGSIELSRLVWRTMCSISEEYLYARYKKSDKRGFRYAKSQLVHVLRQKKWIPQNNNTFVCPYDALREQLPSGFSYDHGQKWLKEVEFGKGAEERSEAQGRERELAKQVGLKPEHIEYVKNNLERIDQLIADESARKVKSTFPTRPVPDSERRQELLGEQLSDSPDKEYEKRQRSVRITNGFIDPITYLRENYTDDDKMVCQICKEEMPFRKRNGKHYFEKKELLSREYLSKEHEAQYLALCPLCAAKYEEFIKKTDDDVIAELKELIVSAEECEIPIALGDEKTSIRFVEKHFQDLKSILMFCQA